MVKEKPDGAMAAMFELSSAGRLVNGVE